MHRINTAQGKTTVKNMEASPGMSPGLSPLLNPYREDTRKNAREENRSAGFIEHPQQA